jgi:hypothetical protein
VLRPALSERSAEQQTWRREPLGLTRTTVREDLVAPRGRPRNVLLRRVLIGAAAGYAAGRAMDLATSWFYARQSEAAKEREEAVYPGGAILDAGRQVAAMIKIENPGEDQIQQLGVRAHRAVGMTYGIVAATLVGFGVRPMKAGMLTGVAAFVLVDEILNAVQLDPSPMDFPIEAHVRGVLGHATFGIALGTGLTLASPLLVSRS